ncbi:hypothetical protein [Nakamurella multipartita]|uniref:Uncharacterized protein n=1 Tax=Nakamurella multipartita (strain ATCC 700099 / DSM 44233 / CIP 104796 / JCM 9543 / NBRC 105858 / Y-104) TaxID=479431 RepID=C8X643_NAKMY|nr:hypothetical protein [Nakamurella multipartita]ACV76814.1 hypothetical protein Namu_0388 [Nakamurella multipartita DSM 44233]
MVGELLGSALVLIGVVMLLMRGRISPRIDGPTGSGLAPIHQGPAAGKRRQLLVACLLLILGRTALVLAGVMA